MCNKIKQRTTSCNRKAVRTLKLVYNDSHKSTITKTIWQWSFQGGERERALAVAPLFIPFDPCRSPDKLKSLFILGNWQWTGGERGLCGGGYWGLEGKWDRGRGILGKMPAWDQWQGQASWNRSSLGWLKERGVVVVGGGGGGVHLVGPGQKTRDVLHAQYLNVMYFLLGVGSCLITVAKAL